MDHFQTLSTLRDEIDDLDARIVELLARRYEKTDEIGRLKLALDLPVSIPARVNHRAALVASLAATQSMNEELAQTIYATINREVVARHRKQGVKVAG